MASHCVKQVKQKTNRTAALFLHQDILALMADTAGNVRVAVSNIVDTKVDVHGCRMLVISGVLNQISRLVTQ